MDAKEKRKLENQLLAEGLAPLHDPELIQQLANLVTNWPGDKHDFLRDLINECDADKRSDMYNAIVPKLGFKALALAQYEAQIALKAGEMVSQGRMRVEGVAPKPIEIGGKKLRVVGQADASGAVARVQCYACGKVERFLADTPAGAMIGARKAGWVRDKAYNKETCADCAAQTASEEIVTLSRKENLIITDRRRSN
jgi:hypothetical protein